jgi:hypothetical protein
VSGGLVHDLSAGCLKVRLLRFYRRNPTANLLYKREEIADSPVVSDFAVLDPHYINGLEMDFTVSWRDAKKGSFVRAVVRLERRHSVTVGKLPVDLRMKVRECRTNVRVEFSYACLVWSSVRLRRVIGEIVGEEFVEDIKSSITLDLFGIPAHNGFCGF